MDEREEEGKKLAPMHRVCPPEWRCAGKERENDFGNFTHHFKMGPLMFGNPTVTIERLLEPFVTQIEKS